MLNRAGKDTANENSNVLIPFADLTRRRTLVIRNIRITLSNVGSGGFIPDFLATRSAARPVNQQACFVSETVALH
jgi:hypothetical protein